jgi:hypothetical protein
MNLFTTNRFPKSTKALTDNNIAVKEIFLEELNTAVKENEKHMAEGGTKDKKRNAAEKEQVEKRRAEVQACLLKIQKALSENIAQANAARKNSKDHDAKSQPITATANLASLQSLLDIIQKAIDETFSKSKDEKENVTKGRGGIFKSLITFKEEIEKAIAKIVEASWDHLSNLLDTKKDATLNEMKAIAVLACEHTIVRETGKTNRGKWATISESDSANAATSARREAVVKFSQQIKAALHPEFGVITKTGLAAAVRFQIKNISDDVKLAIGLKFNAEEKAEWNEKAAHKSLTRILKFYNKFVVPMLKDVSEGPAIKAASDKSISLQELKDNYEAIERNALSEATAAQAKTEAEKFAMRIQAAGFLEDLKKSTAKVEVKCYDQGKPTGKTKTITYNDMVHAIFTRTGTTRKWPAVASAADTKAETPAAPPAPATATAAVQNDFQKELAAKAAARAAIMSNKETAPPKFSPALAATATPPALGISAAAPATATAPVPATATTHVTANAKK